jgi:hypothetical protein
MARIIVDYALQNNIKINPAKSSRFISICTSGGLKQSETFENKGEK